jgi:hypothetical protein
MGYEQFFSELFYLTGWACTQSIEQDNVDLILTATVQVTQDLLLLVPNNLKPLLSFLKLVRLNYF